VVNRERTSGGSGDGELANDELAQIASMVAHELRGTIASIRSLAGTAVVAYEGLSDEERREFFGLIDGESRRLSRITEEISMLLKLQSGSLKYDFREGSITRVVRDSAERAAREDHPLVCEIQEGLTGTFDPSRLADVVAHLVDNAANYSPPESPIGVRAYREGAETVIEVTDRGPGIEPERREEAFGRFAKFRPPGYEEVPGAGLGLFLSRTHVRAHGGSISVSDAPKGATMLRVSLPQAR
jgi:signal transduction histidine kinase